MRQSRPEVCVLSLAVLVTLLCPAGAEVLWAQQAPPDQINLLVMERNWAYLLLGNKQEAKAFT